MCFSFSKKIDEGIKFAKTVVAMGDEKELSSRGYLALGIGYSLLASEGNVFVILKGLRHGILSYFDHRQKETWK